MNTDGARAGAAPRWARADAKKLLKMRLCDLGVSLEGTAVQRRIEQLYEELARKGLRFRPHFWLSDEWFTPNSVPGVAVPFYLAHPRLTRLERMKMFEAEGSSREECLKILRHEAGHAIDHAFRLSRRVEWKKRFGRSSRRYPTTYLPKPTSRRYVQHLSSWYAQAHPDEDFAETFAVWLAPRSNWRTRYEGWPALKKLAYVEKLMGEIAGQTPIIRNRSRVDPVSRIKTTLEEYYDRKQRYYGSPFPDVYDRDLRRLFSDAPEHRHNLRASTFVRSIAPRLRRQIAYWTGESQYTLDQLIKDIVGRCQELNLKVAGDEGRIRTNLGIVLTVHAMTFLQSARRRLTL